MPLSHFRRPLVLAAVSLAAWLAWRPLPTPAAVRPVGGVVRAVVVSPLKEDGRGEKVVVETPDRIRLLAFLPDGAGEPLRPGLPIELTGRLRRPRPARNPGDFDEARFLAQRGISGVFHAETAVLGAALAGRPRLRRLPWFLAEGARRSFENALRRLLPEPQSRVAVGLALGYKGPLPRELNVAVQDAGVMHLLVPSGAKVAFVMLGVCWLALRLRAPPVLRAAAAAGAGGFYTLMVGGDAPYARAFLGGTALLAAPLLGREPGPVQAVALSALLILLHEPLEIHSVGFHMTYAAVLGLALGLPRLRAALPTRWPRWAREAAVLAGIGAIVQLMLWPIFAQVFGKGSLVGPLANVVLVPYSSVLMGAAFAAWAAPAFAEPAVAAALRAGVDLFIAACRTFAAWPGAAVPLSPMSAPALVSFYLASGGVLLWNERRARWALLAAAAAVFAGERLHRAAHAPGLELLLLSLPRGHPAAQREGPPALLTFGGRRHWLVEPSGPPGALAAVLKARGIRRLEAVVASRPVPARTLERLGRQAVVDRVLTARAPWRACLGTVCARFGEPGTALRPPGPRVARPLRGGEAEFCIIALRLKSSAVVVGVDGENVRVGAAR